MKLWKDRIKLKRLINSIGFYAEVRLEIESLPSLGLEIDLGGFLKWRSAIKFAVHYFFERYSKVNSGGLKVSVRYLHEMDIDSSQMVVFFVIVKALCQAFEMESDLRIDDMGNFVIPK